MLYKTKKKIGKVLERRRAQRRAREDFEVFKKMMRGTQRPFSIQLQQDKKIAYHDTKKIIFDAHYTYHPAWAARVLQKTQPESHVDISSKIDFSTIVSAFIPVTFYEYRPANIYLDNLNCKQADLLNLPFQDESVMSLSCMHTVEHIGLGRYGDTLNPEADLQSMRELTRVLAPTGNLLFVVPVGGNPEVRFNADRVYSYEQIREYFSGLTLREFSLIPDDAQEHGMITNATKKDADRQVYGCGCFWFSKSQER